MAPANDEHADEPVQELAEEITEENPDRTTRREALELELMEEGRSDEGPDADLDEAESGEDEGREPPPTRR